MITQSFILCAGKATRLYPITLDKPKCLLSVDEKNNVLEIIIKWLESYSISRHVCNAFWKKELIKEFVTNSKKNIIISEEENILGTFGGLVKAINYLDDKVCVVYGDVVTNANLELLFKQHEDTKADITILSGRSKTPWAGGVLFCEENKVKKIIEKPNREECTSDLINAGIMVINKSAIERYINKNFFDIAKDFIPQCIEDNLNVYHQEIDSNNYFIDMGTFENYEKLKDLIHDNNTNSIKN